MRISRIVIDKKIKEKILYKHSIRASEIKEILLNNPYILKAKYGRYIAIEFYQKYITIVFEFIEDIAYIITAYSSSDHQRKLYKHKRQLN